MIKQGNFFNEEQEKLKNEIMEKLTNVINDSIEKGVKNNILSPENIVDMKCTISINFITDCLIANFNLIKYINKNVDEKQIFSIIEDFFKHAKNDFILNAVNAKLINNH